MSSKKAPRHRGSIFSHTLISFAASCLTEVILVLNTSAIEQLLPLAGYNEKTISGLTGGGLLVLLGVYLLIGIAVYALVFGLLRHRDIRYLQKISGTLQEIAEGDFERNVPVIGDDELSDIALQINHLTEEIRELMRREKDAEQTKNDLITNVAHDLRTPLTSIIGYLDLIRRQPNMDPEKRMEFLKIAYDKSKHLQTLIEELFGFTKLNYGKQTANMQPIDMIRLLGQLLDEFYPVFEQNGMTCEYEPLVPSQMVMGDGVLLARLFDNLVSNAVKYGREGKKLIVEAAVRGQYLVISVINYGKVIPKRDLEHVFDKFYRAEQSRSSQTGGTGLGLAIAKNIAELHNGSIRADSSINGTVFEVSLPILEEKQEGGSGGE